MNRLILFLLVNFMSSLIFQVSANEPIIVQALDNFPQKQMGFHYGSLLLKNEDLGNTNHLDDFLPKLPGVTSAGGTSRSRYFQIRGIGERSSYEGMPNESVAILFDEIDYTGVGGVLETFGLESIEIYKGPQNTNSGPAALAGTIKAKSVDSKIGEIGAGQTQLQSGLASYNSKNIGVVNRFRFKNWSYSFVSNYRVGDGYFKNSFLNREDTNQIQESSFRSKAKIKGWQFNLHYFDFNSGYDVFNLQNSKETQSDKPGRDDQRTIGVSAIHSKKGQGWLLKSIVSGHRTNSFYSYDEDWGNDHFWNGLPNWSSTYDYRIGFTKEMRNLNIEERLSWQTEKAFHTSGIFFKNTHLSSRELAFKNESSRKDLKSTLKRRRLALYHESEVLMGSLIYFIGLRGTLLSSNYFDSASVSLSPQELLWGGQLGFKKESPETYWSLRLSRGFKSGGINIGSNILEDRRLFEEESLYELSFLWERMLNKGKVSLNIFSTYREDVQVKTSYQDNPSDPSSFTFYTDNATTGYSYGAEWDIEYRPLSTYKISLVGNIMDSKFGSYVYGSRNLKGREFAYAPNYKITLTQKLHLYKGLNGQVDISGADRFYFGNSHDENSPQVVTTDLSICYEDIKTYKIALFVRNLFNQRSENRGFFFANRPPSFENERFVQVGPPRTLGITGSLIF